MRKKRDMFTEEEIRLRKYYRIFHPSNCPGVEPDKDAMYYWDELNPQMSCMIIEIKQLCRKNNLNTKDWRLWAGTENSFKVLLPVPIKCLYGISKIIKKYTGEEPEILDFGKCDYGIEITIFWGRRNCESD